MCLSAYETDVYNGKICPYCKSGVKMMSELQVYGKTYQNRIIIVCKNYPLCDAYVGTHDNGTPLGRLADKNLRIAKVQAHKYFDKLWREGYLRRTEAYNQLSQELNIPVEYTHIGMFNIQTCYKVKEWSKTKLESFLNESRN